MVSLDQGDLRQDREAELNDKDLEATSPRGAPIRKDCNSNRDTSRNIPLTAVWTDMRNARPKLDRQ